MSTLGRTKSSSTARNSSVSSRRGVAGLSADLLPDQALHLLVRRPHHLEQDRVMGVDRQLDNSAELVDRADVALGTGVLTALAAHRLRQEEGRGSSCP